MVWPLSCPFFFLSSFSLSVCFPYLDQPCDYAWLVNAQIISCQDHIEKWKTKKMKNGFYWMRWLCRVAHIGIRFYLQLHLYVELPCAHVRLNKSSSEVFRLKPDHTFIAFLRLNRIHSVCITPFRRAIYAQKHAPMQSDSICWHSHSIDLLSRWHAWLSFSSSQIEND